MPNRTPQELVEDALVTLLLKWGGRSEAHVVEEARFTAQQFLHNYPAIHQAIENEQRLNELRALLRDV